MQTKLKIPVFISIDVLLLLVLLAGRTLPSEQQVITIKGFDTISVWVNLGLGLRLGFRSV